MDISTCCTYLTTYSRMCIKKEETIFVPQVANTGVRNIGTIAGNLMLKHGHNDFPSDIFILLEAVKAKVVIKSKAAGEVKASPIEFLGLEMKKSVVVRIEIPPASALHKFASYKITPRSVIEVTLIIF